MANLKLQYGSSAQVDAASCVAGTMYLAQRDNSSAALFFDMGGTRLEIIPTVLSEDVVDDFVDQIVLQHNN